MINVKLPAQGKRLCHRPMDTTVPGLGTGNFLCVVFQHLEVQAIIGIGFTTVQVEATRKQGFQDFRGDNSESLYTHNRTGT